jgi:anti-sigma B factor antagonist
VAHKITLEHKIQGSVVIVRVKGFMDLLQVEHFEHYLDEVIKNQTNKIVLDLSELEYISSAGLGAIIGRIRDVRTKGGDIKIGNCSSTVADILEILGFALVFSLAKTNEEAMRLFGAAQP